MIPRPEIILGPPGTGKTTTLLGMVDDELIASTHPSRIAYLSFTRRAAEEAITRAVIKFGVPQKEFPWFRTLHSLCFRFLGMSSGVVFEGKRVEEFAIYVGEKVTGRFNREDGTYLGYEPGDRMLFLDNLARVRGVSLADQYNKDFDELEWFRLQRFSESLKQFKADRGLIDYTDMLQQFADGDVAPPLDVVIVDEAQDLSRLQWQVISKLADGARRLVIAGDDDQAIYRWAGADVDAFISMQGDVRVLNQSYRIPVVVQNLALDIISRVNSRREKVWAPRSQTGNLTFHRSLQGVDWTGTDSILVLARNANILRGVEKELRSAGLYFEKHGSPSILPTTIRAIVFWEELRKGKALSVEEVRFIYEKMKVNVQVRHGYKGLRGNKVPWNDEDTVTLEDLQRSGGLLVNSIWHEALGEIPASEIAYIQRCRRRGEKLREKPRIRLSTIHGAKGAEADRVILLTDMAPRTAAEMRLSPDDEHRTWYVGVTRAKHHLEIIAPSTHNFYPL